jgi:hypothetical protein
MRYIQAENTGKGFITHQDREDFEIQGFGDIWVTDDSDAAVQWSIRVNGTELTKEQAEAVVNVNTQEGEFIKLP